MENQNPTPPVSPNQTTPPPVIPNLVRDPSTSENSNKTKSKFPILLIIIGVVQIFFIASNFLFFPIPLPELLGFFYSNLPIPLLLVILSLLALSQIMIGILMIVKNIKTGGMHKLALFTIAASILLYAVAPFIFLKAVAPELTELAKPTPIVQKQIPSPTSDPTINWQEFSNSKRSYTFKYPTTYNLKQTEKSGTDLESVYLESKNIVLDGDKDHNAVGKGASISFTYFDTGKESYKDSLAQFGKVVVQRDQTSGKKTYVINNYSSSTKTEIIPLPNGFLEINLTTGYRETKEIQAKYMNELNQILSTFKFKDVQPQDGSVIKTYTNADGGYSIQYPGDASLDEGESSGVDGVIWFSKNITSITTTFKLTIEYSDSLGLSTEEKVAKEVGTTQKGEPYILGGENAYMFIDVPGPYNTNIAYIEHGNKSYKLRIETGGQYSKIKNDVDKMLSTFKFTI